ncbi:MAG: M14 family zinc carboxypeptidase [Phycisphaerales bacterium]
MVIRRIGFLGINARRGGCLLLFTGLVALAMAPTSRGSGLASSALAASSVGAASANTLTAAAPDDLPPGIDPELVDGLMERSPTPIDWASLDLDPAVPAPATILGHALGERFVRHASAVAWCRTLAAASPRVRLIEYGTSIEGRPLLVLAISSEANIDRLDAILAANALVPRGGDSAPDDPAIAWFSFNVHGNESSCTDAGLQLAHLLAAGQGPAIQAGLDACVTIIDPCLNPDGRERYVSFYDQRVGRTPDPWPLAAEHLEPWPSGRPNHAMFDLNRDWVWGSQPESRQRMALYRRVLPHLHVDVHEQGASSPYFLGAGDAPYNANLGTRQRSWFEAYGRTMGEAFDDAGFVFATRERFDYLYPGYGKVLPCYHGAVGLLLEQAGHGRAGLAITVDGEHGPGLELTLTDRIRHHVTACLQAWAFTGAQRSAQRTRLAEFFRSAAEGRRDRVSAPENDDVAAAWIIQPGDDPRPVRDFLMLCRLHGIDVGRVDRDVRVTRTLPGFTGSPASAGPVDVPAGSLIVPGRQPMARLADALMRAAPVIEDRDTYDITSWSVPAQFGLDVVTLAASAPLPAASLLEASELPAGPPALDADWDAFGDRAVERADRRTVVLTDLPADALALLIPADRMDFVRALGAAARHNLFARRLGRELMLPGGRSVPAGSLAIHLSRNEPERIAAFRRALVGLEVEVLSVDRTVPMAGPALGNNENRRFIVPRRIVLVGHPPMNSLSFGHLRHQFDHRAEIDHSVLRAEDLGDRGVLEPGGPVDVIVLPSSSGLSGTLGTRNLERLGDWVRGGGTLVAVGDSANWAGRTLLELTPEDIADAAPADAADDPDFEFTPSDELSTLSHAERDRRSVARRVPGAMVRADVDTTHPLMFGAAASIPLHVFGGNPLPVAGSGEVLARFAPADALVIGGSIGPRARARLAGRPAMTRHAMGGGQVISIVSDPANRAMNRVGMDALMRAILSGPSMAPSRRPLGLEDAHRHGSMDD